MEDERKYFAIWTILFRQSPDFPEGLVGEILSNSIESKDREIKSGKMTIFQPESCFFGRSLYHLQYDIGS